MCVCASAFLEQFATFLWPRTVWTAETSFSLFSRHPNSTGCFFHFLFRVATSIYCVCVFVWPAGCAGKIAEKSTSKATQTHTHSLREWHCSRKICFSNSNKTEINTPWEGDSNGRSSRRWTTMTVAKSALQIVFFVLMFWQVSLLWTHSGAGN